MMQLDNNSPFAAMALPLVCHEDRNHVVAIIKGTYNILPAEQRVVLSTRQNEIFLEDQFWGEPGQSSLKHEADSALSKPGTDVMLVGKAHVANGQARQLDVRVQAGSLSKRIRVFGNRTWKKSGGVWQMTAPEPFQSMPLVYEYAFGGRGGEKPDGGPREFDGRNPVGKGFVDRALLKQVDEIPLPNLELPDQLLTDIGQKPEPAGVGPRARHWEPRRLMMGTYDEEWESQRNPLLPLDFDPASSLAASAGLTSETRFQGGEKVILENMSPHGRVEFELPHDRPRVISRIEGQVQGWYPALDTVVVESEARKVSLTWRVAIPCHWNLAKVEWLVVEKEA